jgi:recombination protein RecA
MYGSPETTSGGNALKFYASVRLDIRRIGSIKKGTEEIGNRTRVKVVKNKLAPPFRKVEFDILFGTGISSTGELIDMGLELDLVSRSGAWFSVGEVRVGQGRDNARIYLDEHPELRQGLSDAIRAHHLGGTDDIVLANGKPASSAGTPAAQAK